MDTDEQYGRPRLKRKAVLGPKPDSDSQDKSAPDNKTAESEGQVAGKTFGEAKEQTVAVPPKKPERTAKPSRRPDRDRWKSRPERAERSDSPRQRERQVKTARPPKKKKTSSVKLSVVIPAYNEEDNIIPLLEQFKQVFSDLPFRAELVLVDDGSTDKTAIRLKEGQLNYPWLRVFRHRTNLGITPALETGFSKAVGKIICFYPADLQYHANEIPKFVSKIDSGVDIVTGWKQGKYGLKSIGSAIYNMLSRLLFKVKVHDLNSIKAFKRDVMECFTYRRGWHRYIVVMAAQHGYVIDEVKVRLFPRRSGKTKFGFWRLPIGFLDLLSVKFQLSFTRKPLLFFGSAGLVSGLLGFLVGLVAIYFRVMEHSGFRPLLYLVILLMVSGLLLFAIGFLAELIVSIKEDLRRR